MCLNGLQKVVKEICANRMCYLFLLPAVIYTLLFGYFTLPYMVIAFERYDFTKGIGSPWVGFKNFEFFFKSSEVWVVTRNTIVLNGLFIVCGTVVAIALALLFNEVKKKLFLKTAQSFMLFPHFISWVIVSYILYALLSTNGLLNHWIAAFGGNPVRWYSEPNAWYVILVALYIVKNAGYTSIIYLASITSIDEGLYEAAVIDGANRWQQMKHITLPLLMPTVSILALMSIGRIFFADFGMMYALIKDNGLLLPVADVIDTYVFRMMRVTGEPSLAMAVGLFQSAVGFFMVYGSNALAKKKYPDGALF
ncbi:sugar ABC transporter permease [Gordoniibacillus kamchatkensis]|uniref:Sugar ABC transporter permease n=2 Tax=Gordoniibacillus kamchatkensis TaxID=1590651 RepID=A0ABR5AHK5_9BACL|nr:sugar ABC transporter permease [Paenibacillus sp. VKM B-2647]